MEHAAPTTEDQVLARARGCLLGQPAGDALGSLVEFKTPEEIRREYPEVFTSSLTEERGTLSPDNPPTIPRWLSPWPGCLRNKEDIPRRRLGRAVSSGWSPIPLTTEEPCLAG